MNKELLKGNSEMIILSALASKPMHGYALSQKLQQEMPDMFKFGVGMLYPLLHRLEKKKLITGSWITIDNAKKRVYSLTKKGKKQLTTSKHEWQMFNKTVSKLVNLPLSV